MLRGVLGAVTRYSGFALGSAASTACSFASSLLLIRELQPASFGAYNLVLTLATMMALASSGLDLSYSRLRARHDVAGRAALARDYVRIKTRMVALLGVLGAVALPALAPRGTDLGLAASALLLYAAGTGGFAVAVSHAQAIGSATRYSLLQIVPFAVLLVGLLLSLPGGLSVERALVLLAVSGLPGIAVLALTRRRLGGRGHGRHAELRHTAVVLTISTALTAVFERVDVVLVARTLDEEALGVFSAGVRVAGGFAVLSSAFVAYSLKTSSETLTATAMAATYRRLAGPLAAIFLASAVGSIVCYLALPTLLGVEYTEARIVTAVYVLQYPLVALYMPAVLAMINFGRRLWQVELAVLLLVSEMAWILLGPRDLLWIAAASPVSHCLGGLYVARRVWRAARGDGQSAGWGLHRLLPRRERSVDQA